MSVNVNRAIKTRVKQLKIDVTYSKKGHYNAASVWNTVHYTLGITTVGLAAFIGVKNQTLGDETVALLSMITAALGAITTFLKPQEKATQHKLSGDDFDNLLQDICTFHDVDMLQGTDVEHTEQLKLLSGRKTKLNKSSLPIPRIAYTSTRKGILSGEAAYTENL